ncbi:hypothetical protein ACI8AA_21950 [Geodermatophilus sp. SYSU D01180]
MTRDGTGPVAAVVPDDLDAVRAVRYAARLARSTGRPLLLLVPLAGPRVSPDAAPHPAARRRLEAEATAVLGRVEPALTRHPTPVTAVVVTSRPHRSRGPAPTGVLRAADRGGAEVLVTTSRWVGLPGPPRVVLLDPATGHAATGQLATAPGTPVAASR